MTLEIRKCPFCGGEGMLLQPSVIYSVTCADCAASVVGTTPQKALDRWNRRAIDDVVLYEYHGAEDVFTRHDPE